MSNKTRVKINLKDSPFFGEVGYIDGYVYEAQGDSSEIYGYVMAIVIVDKKITEISIDCLEVLK